MAGHEHNVKDIMFEALDRPAAQRRAYLDDACAGRATLRAQVEQLIEAHEDAGRFMAAPTADGLTSAFPAELVEGDRTLERPGMQLGRYRLVRLLGEGGFGTVYLAEQQTPVYRRVALKVLKPGMDTRQVIARFEAEHQALALMDHPSIAKVYDAAETPSGRPYVVMEYIDGDPVTLYCDRKRLSVRDRLQVFEGICMAVQHAHQKGIIHRDIKPNNVLVTEVDGKPVPKIIDFGIAKAIGPGRMEKTAVTEERQLVGTPEFMSPEQASMSPGDVDTRADIYSLGVLLYELLIGVPPFDREKLRSASLMELGRIIREEEPQRPSLRLHTADRELGRIAEVRRSDPSRLMREVRGELDWIVMRAVEKDRNRRYSTAQALATDVGRYLRDEPVEASPPSRTYRTSKFVRRHRIAIAGVGVVAMSLIAIVVVSTLFAARAEAARQQATTDARRAETQLTKAEAISEFLQSILSGVEPAVAQGADRTLMKMILNDSIERVDRELQGQPEVELAVRMAIADACRAVRDYDQSISQYNTALELIGEVHGDDHPLAWECRAALSLLYIATSQHDVGLPILHDTIKRYTRTHGPDASETIRLRLIEANYNARRGSEADSEREYRELVERAVNALGPDHETTVLTRNSHANVLTSMGRPEEAVTIYEQILAMQERSYGENHPRLLTTQNNLAETLAKLGRNDEAEPLYRKVLEGKIAILGDDNAGTILTQANYARFLSDIGRYEASEPMFVEALALARARLGPHDLRTLALLNNMAGMYMASDRFAEAEPLLREAREGVHATFGPDNKYALMIGAQLADVLVKLDRPEEAEREGRDALERAERVFPPDHWTLAGIRARYARTLFGLDRLDEAEAAYLAAYPPLAAHFAPDSERVRSTVEALVRIYEQVDRPDDAATWRARLGEPHDE